MIAKPGARKEAIGSLGLAVLNPGGNDPDQPFPDGAGTPGAAGHPPVNYHAYAACTAGGFYRNAAAIGPGRPVLLLLRRDLKLGLKTLATLQAGGRTVAVSLKESGSHQVAALLADAARLALFREIVAQADFCLSSTPDLVPFYRGAGARRAEFVPTPYPVEESAWDFSMPIQERRGVFVGTREFDVPSRNHLAALLAVKELGEPVTVVNLDGRRGCRRLEALGFEEGRLPGLRIVEGRMDYPRYLKLMAAHRIVFQLDRSAVPGQVAGDALLCRVPCVGGDGAVERLAFPGLCGHGRTASELLAQAARLLGEESEAVYAGAVEESQRLARETLSFAVVARRLETLYRA